jgi:type I restriction enzyme R subunit
MNLIRNIHFDDKKQKDYDIKHIKEELSRTDNPQLLRKVEILQAFLDRVVVGLESADEIDAAYNDFENEAKREEIVAFAKTNCRCFSIRLDRSVNRFAIFSCSGSEGRKSDCP